MRYHHRRAVIRMIGAAGTYGLIGARPLSAGTGINPGSQFPDVMYKTEDGQKKTVAASTGKVAMLYLWAVWCPICYNDIVNIQAIYDRLKSNPGFSPIVLNVMEPYERGVSWARGRGLSLPLSNSGMESRSSTIAATTTGTFQFPRYTPQFYILDRSGKVSSFVNGEAAGTQANEDTIRKLLLSTV